METIAIYWEPKIKTYGIAERIGLSMVSLDLLTEEMIAGEDRLRRVGSAAGEFLLVFARPSKEGGFRLHLLFERRPSWHLLEEFSGVTGGGRSSGLRVDDDVELVYFQGPHFVTATASPTRPSAPCSRQMFRYWPPHAPVRPSISCCRRARPGPPAAPCPSRLSYPANE
jgi:hypothetical protein